MNDHHLGFHSQEAKDREAAAFDAVLARKLPSVAQMRARSEDGHRHILAAIAAGRPYVTPAHTIGQVRGYSTARLTLHRWGCLEWSAETGDRITPRGAQLLAAFQH